MMPRDVRKYLFDIAEAGRLLSEFTAGKTLAEYSQSALLRSAVERQFEIIGEALQQAVHVDAALAGRITDCRRIIAFRNRLIHGYANVAAPVVWGIIELHLPTLRQEVDRLLDELGHEQ